MAANLFSWGWLWFTQTQCCYNSTFVKYFFISRSPVPNQAHGKGITRQDYIRFTNVCKVFISVYLEMSHICWSNYPHISSRQHEPLRSCMLLSSLFFKRWFCRPLSPWPAHACGDIIARRSDQIWAVLPQTAAGLHLIWKPRLGPVPGDALRCARGATGSPLVRPGLAQMIDFTSATMWSTPHATSTT